MAINLPSYKKTRISLGAGIVKIGIAAFTPSVDIGSLRSASLQVTRTRVEVQQGVPRVTIFQLVTSEEVIFSLVGLEWAIERLQDVLAVTTAITGASGSGGGTLGFGGDVNLREVAIWFQHQMPSGGTIHTRIWRAQGQGEATINFGDGTDVHELPASYKAVNATTNWSGGTLAADEQLVQFQIQAPIGGFI